MRDAVQDCHDLLRWLLRHLDKFPRARRFALGERLEGGLLDVLAELFDAAYRERKRLRLHPRKPVPPPPGPGAPFVQLAGPEQRREVLLEHLDGPVLRDADGGGPVRDAVPAAGESVLEKHVAASNRLTDGPLRTARCASCP